MSKQTASTGKPTRSAAQIKADKAYQDRNRQSKATQQKQNFKNVAATLPKTEAERIKGIFKAHGMKPAEVIRRAAVRMEQGDDLRRDYDPTSNTLQPAQQGAGGNGNDDSESTDDPATT